MRSTEFAVGFSSPSAFRTLHSVFRTGLPLLPDFAAAPKVPVWTPRKGVFPVLVAATTECFLDLSLPAALDRLADLEFTSVELALFEDADHLKPSQVLADVERAAALCRNA